MLVQIEEVVDKLKERGERILVLIPHCYTTKTVPNSVRKFSNKYNKSTEDDQVCSNVTMHTN